MNWDKHSVYLNRTYIEWNLMSIEAWVGITSAEIGIIVSKRVEKQSK